MADNEAKKVEEVKTETQVTPVPKRTFWQKAATATTIIAGVTTACLAAVMIYDRLTSDTPVVPTDV